MSRLALLYMTREGQTKKIMRHIAASLRESGHDVFLSSIQALPWDFSLSGYDAAVLGCSVRYGRHHQPFMAFIERYKNELDSMPGFFFSVNLTARKPERSEPYNNRYLQKFLARLTWRPTYVEVFAGALLYTRYNWLDRVMIQLIMRMTKGPVDPGCDTEFTDWKRVRLFSERVSRELVSYSSV